MYIKAASWANLFSSQSYKDILLSSLLFDEEDECSVKEMQEPVEAAREVLILQQPEVWILQGAGLVGPRWRRRRGCGGVRWQLQEAIHDTFEASEPSSDQCTYRQVQEQQRRRRRRQDICQVRGRALRSPSVDAGECWSRRGGGRRCVGGTDPTLCLLRSRYENGRVQVPRLSPSHSYFWKFWTWRIKKLLYPCL